MDRTDFELLNHTAIVKMIMLKRNKFGLFWLGIESLFYIALTIICTCANIIGKDVTNTTPFTDPTFVSWIIILFLGQIMILLRAANVRNI